MKNSYDKIVISERSESKPAVQLKKDDISKPSCDDLINIFNDPFVIIDRHYQIVASNKAYRNSFHTKKQIDGMFCYEISHDYNSPCSQHGEHCPLETVMRTGKSTSVLHIHKHGDEEEHVQISASPIHNDQGEIHYMGETMVTITQEEKDPQLLIGRTPAILRLTSILHRVAPTLSTVFIEGESGVGKDCVANYIHHFSKRSCKPMIVVDCGAIGETLIESELFGYEKGAFTGATKQKIGLIESANGGTLFVDEIGELSLDLQTKLLRVLESSTIRRIGGTHYFDVDVRIIAATNQDVKKMVSNGTFRQDLYYRLATFPVHVPPLRDRKADIPAIAEHFLRKIEDGAQHIPLHSDIIEILSSYNFPGNIRELRNIMERAVILSAGDPITEEHLTIDKNPHHILNNEFDDMDIEDFPTTHHQTQATADIPPPTPLITKKSHKPDLETVKHTLEAHNGHRLSAAQELGISERTLYRYLQKISVSEQNN
ncbi:MAG: sigma-54-dependent Fis family transcriptional regulator [gamma proteobacterium symbiont of Bathyaustriella thionipta]|nr:sigma-54-dependent Fis family transcriptional regulator [gamma proteobacterium symbiont of Bathyaustriella thionipta]MCU7950026.1 sigma-54-dependent Fis family transcriptional regulator [gamma proteobacterium symbiont of Bathyaustriella thionipta]MCU7952537.1 sigma-54-dependent Fis family transcriptional regulator [gamma proteobacterium symbiont of Bathyaustriella thionipta]MCU7958033.1 sigma-54-dependent Fis family transcriptional regulator [gamma proteobacterium symbiont of Bathyaustriella 